MTVGKFLGAATVKIKGFAESHEYIAAALFFALLIIICFGNVVFFNATLTTSLIEPGTLPTGPYQGPPKTFITVIDPGASAFQQEPEYVFSSLQFQSGIFPLWNPYSGFGTPYLAELQPAVLYPLNFLVFFGPSALMWSTVNFLLLLKLFIAGFFTYCFLREIEVSKYGSLVSGVGFMFTGYLILYVNMMHLNTVVLFPVLLFVFERQIKSMDLKYAILGAILIALAIFGGMPESALYILMFAGLYYIYRIFSEFYKRRSTRDLAWNFILLAIAIGGGVLLSAVQILPFIEFWEFSWNMHPPMFYALKFSFDVVSLVIPYFYGWIHFPWNGLAQSQILPYIGIFVSYFALLALTRKNRLLQFSIFFAGFALFYLLKAFGFPLLGWIDVLPLFSVSNFPKYCFPEFAFCIAVLAGIGAGNLGVITRKRIYLQSLVFAAVIAILVLGKLPALLSSGWIVSAYGLTVDAVSWVTVMVAFGFLVLGIITLFLLAFCKGWLTLHQLEALLMVVLVAELFIYVPHIQGQRTDPFNTPPYIDFLKNDTDIYRVTGFNKVLYPNTAIAYQISDIREKDPVQVSRYMTFLHEVMGAPGNVRYDGVYQDINFGTLDMMNVKYVLAATDIGTITQEDLIDEISRNASLYHSGQVGRIYTSSDEGKSIFVVSAPTRIDYTFAVPENAEKFYISAGIQASSWNEESDGVNFSVRIVSDRGDEVGFSRTLDPAHHKEDRGWHTGAIDLTPYRGETVHLLLVTDPGGNTVGDKGAAWANPGLETGDTLQKTSELEKKLTMVYNDEIIIYENRDVIPRAYFTSNADILDSDDEVLRELADVTFDARNRVLLSREDILPAPVISLADEIQELGNSTVNIVSYGSENLEIEVQADRPGILVVSDAYYPGWNAYLDGNATAIFPADYAFRGVYLEPGDHTVTMAYEPESFRNGVIISLITAVLLGIGYVLSRKWPRVSG